MSQVNSRLMLQMHEKILHHGGRVRKGSKIVVQLMLDWTGLGSDSDLGEGEGRDMAASITTRIKNGTEGGCHDLTLLRVCR